MSHPELASALRAVLASVREYPGTMTRSEMDQFYELAKKVRVEAVKAGLDDRLPKVSELAPALEHPDLPKLPPVKYETRLNLPGDWIYAQMDEDDLLPLPHCQDGDPEPLPAKVFQYCPPPAWFGALEELLAIAESASTPRADRGEPPAQLSIEQQMERVAQAVGDDNAARIMAIANRMDWSGEHKMEEILRIDRRFADKDSNEWGTLLKVSPAAVRGYNVWKRLQQAKKATD